MKLYTTETKQIQSLTALVCDKCKRQYADHDEMQEFHHIGFQAGYGSVFGDGNEVQCDICQDCLKELISPFARIFDPNN